MTVFSHATSQMTVIQCELRCYTNYIAYLLKIILLTYLLFKTLFPVLQ